MTIKVVSSSGGEVSCPRSFVVRIYEWALVEELEQAIHLCAPELPVHTLLLQGKVLREGRVFPPECTFTEPNDTTVYLICQPPQSPPSTPPPVVASSLAVSSVGLKVGQINQIVRGMLNQSASPTEPPNLSNLLNNQLSVLGPAEIPKVISQLRTLLSDTSPTISKSLASQLGDTAQLIGLLKERLLQLTTLLASGPCTSESAKQEAATIASVLQHMALLISLVATALNNSRVQSLTTSSSQPTEVNEPAQPNPNKRSRTTKQGSS
ncbi:hypothetical protein Pelo_12381 [Pelomyxa schiedti]|nr:hypothetical protein Pelo_12381 [Pelomyxa schiedti]